MPKTKRKIKMMPAARRKGVSNREWVEKGKAALAKMKRAAEIDRTIPRLEMESDSGPGVSLASALSNAMASLLKSKMPKVPDLSQVSEEEKTRVISMIEQRTGVVEKEARDEAQPLLWKEIHDGQRVLTGRMGGRSGPLYEFRPADIPFTTIEKEEDRNHVEPRGLHKHIVFAAREVVLTLSRGNERVPANQLFYNCRVLTPELEPEFSQEMKDRPMKWWVEQVVIREGLEITAVALMRPTDLGNKARELKGRFVGWLKDTHDEKIEVGDPDSFTNRAIEYIDGLNGTRKTRGKLGEKAITH